MTAAQVSALFGLGSTETRVWLIVVGLAVAAGCVAAIVVLVHNYRLERRADDREWRQAGHVPPETDPERTLMIPVIRTAAQLAEDGGVLAYGKHSTGWMHIGDVDYQGAHRRRWFAVWQLKAADLVSGRHHMAGVA